MKSFSLRLMLILTIFFFGKRTYSQSAACEITKVNGGGFSTTIKSVVCNPNNTYTIVLHVTHNGCGGPRCRELSHLSIEAAPGTYSNMSLQVLSGSMTGGNLVVGPNLGSDPFQGFKFDNTKNIGGGKAGVLKITYTLTSLQNQRVSAKAGTNGQIVNFSVADFTYVMNCNGTGCTPAPADTDGDGVPDGQDEFPNDPQRAFSSIAAQGTLAFEDLWPYNGDYDFNDMVIEYKLTAITNSLNKVKDIKASFTLKAFGAGFKNGFGFQFGSTSTNQSLISATGFSLSENIISLNSNGLEAGQSIPTVIVFDNAYSLMPHPGQGAIGVNTTPGATYREPQTVLIDITFSTPTYTIAQLNLTNFNPFIFSNLTRGREIHLPDKAPTSLANTALFGTGDDDSNPSAGRYYKNKQNLPWAIHIPGTFDYPIEKTPITSAHLKFSQWAMSSGMLFPDWYLNLSGYRDNTKIYQKP
ncbi:MAG: LruC domain-containing protein [Thermaurantimonas sp.]|uniref:LruC domain-containing protein n=1 Tax=Thermaurantimonas sp. TaxID=2681568 RepID=UPI00391BF213